MASPPSFAGIVAKFGHLKQLTARAARLGELEDLVRGTLPAALRRHVHLAAIRDGCLVLLADGPAWATQLRYRTPEILTSLPAEPEFDGVRSIRVRTARAGLAPATPAPRRERPGQAAIAALEAQADSTADPRLRAALRRLATHAARR